MSIYHWRDYSEGSSLHASRHPFDFRSSSSTPVPHDPEVSPAYQPADVSESVNGVYYYTHHINCDIAGGQRVNSELVERGNCPNSDSGLLREISARDRGHCVRNIISLEAEPPKFDGVNLSFLEFIEEFMRVADHNGWGYKEKMFHLRSSIVGNAKIRMKTMPYPTNLDSFMKELLSTFHNERTVEAYKDQLANVKRASSMDLETYGYYLIDLASKAHPSAVAHEQERIAKECFFKTAGSCDLHVWLIARGPKTMKDTIDLAIQYERAMVDHAARRPSVPLPMQVASKSATSVIEEQLRGMIADLEELKDQLRFGSHQSSGKDHCKCCDCRKSRPAVQQMKSLGPEVKAFGEKVNHLILQVKPRLFGLGDKNVATISCKSGKQRQYTCSVCPKAFNVKRNLKAHLDTAHASGFWGFECPKVGCERTFHPVHKGLMKAHLRVGHD